MRGPIPAAAGPLIALGLLVACSSGSGGLKTPDPPEEDTLAGGSAAEPDVAAESDGAAPEGDGATAEPDGAEGGEPDPATEPKEEPLPNACEGQEDCGAESCQSGVCVDDPPPGSESFVTDLTNKPTAEPPHLVCADSPAEAPEGPDEVILWGAVTRFGSGLVTHDIIVEVFDSDTWDPGACEVQTDEDALQECYRAYGEPLGSTTTTPVDEVGDIECDHTSEVDECPMGYECVEESSIVGACQRQFGFYSIEGVPTNTPLVIRSRPSPQLSRFQQDNWHDTYHFNVWLFADRVVDGAYRYDATMVSDGQWHITPNTVGLADVPEDHGVVGGRVRDCRIPGERDSWPVNEVSIALARPAVKVAYFNNLEKDTVPLVERLTTNDLGRYAALDIPLGWNVVSGSARVGSEVVSVGAMDVYVIPNALSIVTWPGRQHVFKQEPSFEFP